MTLDVNLTLVDKIDKCSCFGRGENSSNSDTDQEIVEKKEIKRKNKKKKKKEKEETSFVIIDEGTDITTHQTTYNDFEEMIEHSEEQDIILLNKKGKLHLSKGPNVNIFIRDCKSGENIVEKWTEWNFTFLVAIFQGIVEEKSRPQIEITVNSRNLKLRLCGNFTVNKRDEIDLVQIISRPSFASVEDVKKKIAL